MEDVMRPDYTSSIQRVEASRQAPSLDNTMDELARQTMRLDELVVKAETMLMQFMVPDKQPQIAANYGSSDVPGDTSPVAARIYSQADNLRLTGNRLEAIIRRIDV